jgi:hypothetical protein
MTALWCKEAAMQKKREAKKIRKNGTRLGKDS